METFLNLLWLSIAVAATVRFAIRSAQEPSDLAFPQRRRLAATALLCVIFLLFPIISVTDDLHEDAALVEETSGPRRVSAAHHPTRSGGHGLSPAVLCARAALVLGLVSFHISDVPALGAYIAPAAVLAPPRGPPLSRR